MSALQNTAHEPQILHAFETPRGRDLFQAAFGVTPDNIVVDHIGGRLGLRLPDNALVYLWPLLDYSGGAWVDNVAIGCAKTKLKVADPGPSEDLYRWLRSPPTAADLQRVLDDAEAVAHIDEESDYDLLLEVKKKADAMTQE